MATTVAVDKAGRLVLPKSVRESLGIAPGDQLEITADEARIILSPVRVGAGLRKEFGVWVYRSGQPATKPAPDLVERAREERMLEVLGDQR
jgi:AbrB family looped-hinge helix DNA binding protein